MKKGLGSKIMQIRKLKGYSQEYIANELGISQRAYSKMETGETKIDWNKITKIAHILEINPMDIVAFDDNLIFHNCSQSGKFEQFNNNLPKELIESYNARIKELQEQIDFLKRVVLKERKNK